MLQFPERLDRRVSYTLVEDCYDNRVLDANRFHDVAWGDFVELMLSAHEAAPRKDHVKLISPVRFLNADDPACQHAPFTEGEAKAGYGTQGTIKMNDAGLPYTWRGACNVESWWMLPVDVDGQQSIDSAKRFFADYSYVAYTSFNHLADRVTQKFRLFLLLEQPVDQSEFEKRRPAILKWLGPIDTSSLSASRAFYLPCCPQERVPVAERWFNEGTRCVDAMAFAPPAPVDVSASEPPSGLQRDVLLEMLRETFLGNYEEWWKVSVAMAAAGYALPDFQFVTVGGMMNQKDVLDCERQWSKAIASVRRGRTIHIGYLYNLVGGGKAVKRRAIEKEIAELQKVVGDES